jgi:hypothetical protein
MAAALTDGYAAGLMVAALFFTAGAVVALAAIRSRPGFGAGRMVAQ